MEWVAQRVQLQLAQENAVSAHLACIMFNCEVPGTRTLGFDEAAMLAQLLVNQVGECGRSGALQFADQGKWFQGEWKVEAVRIWPHLLQGTRF